MRALYMMISFIKQRGAPYMAIFYKLFHRARIVFLLMALVVVGSQPAHAQNSLFTVDNVRADVSAANAIAAREKAFTEAQTEAFKTLTERMLSEGELRDFIMPEGLALSSLIQDFEVSGEKLSSTRYSAVYKFRFKDDKVRDFLSRRGASYTDVASKPILVLPFLETNDGTILWSPANGWMKAWNFAPEPGGLVPLIVPIGDLMDVKDIGDEEALTYNRRRLNSMLRRYNASEAVIAIARYADNGSIEVQIYRTDRDQPEYVHQVIQPVLAGQSNAAYMAAVNKVRAALQREWKEKTVIDSAQAATNTIKVRARFTSLGEWSQLQRTLRRVEGLRSFQLQALSPREAYLDLAFQGDVSRLQLALSQFDLALEGGAGAFTRGERVFDLVQSRYSQTFQRYGTGADDGRAPRDPNAYDVQF
jgi:hypothetical protein